MTLMLTTSFPCEGCLAPFLSIFFLLLREREGQKFQGAFSTNRNKLMQFLLKGVDEGEDTLFTRFLQSTSTIISRAFFLCE